MKGLFIFLGVAIFFTAALIAARYRWPDEFSSDGWPCERFANTRITGIPARCFKHFGITHAP